MTRLSKILWQKLRQLLWPGTRAALLNVTLSGTHNLTNYCVILYHTCNLPIWPRPALHNSADRGLETACLEFLFAIFFDITNIQLTAGKSNF